MAPKIDPLRAQLFEQKQRNLFCDVTLVATADGTRIRAHRNILHTASEFFEGLLSANMEESTLHHEIRFDGIDGAVLRQLVDYAYTRSIDIDASNVHDILAAADRFLFDGVVRVCVKFYLKLLDGFTAIRTETIAERYRLIKLRHAATAFANNHFMDAVKSQAFLELEADAVVSYISRDAIQPDSEEDVFNAIARWVEVDADERKQHYAALMKGVRISAVDHGFFNGRILEWSREISMGHVYVDAFAEKCRQDAQVTDVDRTPHLEYLFAVGQLRSGVTQIERYSLASNSWKVVKKFHKSQWYSIHCIKNCLYLFCDGNGKMTRMPLATMQLETRKPINVNKRDHYISIAVGPYVYCIGGSFSGVYAMLERYNTTTDEWLDLANLNYRRFLADAAVLAGKVYVVGGVISSDIPPMRSVERYDPETNQWTNVAELNVGRYRHRCCTIRGSIYAVGGYIVNDHRIASIEKYDEQLDRWTIIEHGLDVACADFGIAVLGDWIYVVDGLIDSEENDNLRKINVRDGRLEKLASTNFRMARVFGTLAPYC